jgi:cysteine desulfurase
MIYLDYAAATPLDPQVQAAMQPYWQEKFYNPSANYLAGRAVAADIATVRASVARQLGAKPSEIIFTAGGTESDNLAIDGVMQLHPKANLLVSAVEHEAVLQAASTYQHQLIPVDAHGVVDLAALAKQIDDKTVLVSVMYANNEIGTVQPLRKVADLIQQVLAERQKTGNKLPLYFHADASQAANYLDIHVSRLGIDLMTLNGGKMYGPKQTGVLFVRAGLILRPQVRGGGQERGLRSGTENVAGVIGLAKALEVAQSMRTEESKRLQALRLLFVSQLTAAVPGVVTNGSKHCLPNIVHVTVSGTDNERLMMELDEQGIICAVGSACSASSDEPSHVLTAIGLSDTDAQSSLRFSLGRQTTQKDVEATVLALQKITTA